MKSTFCATAASAGCRILSPAWRCALPGVDIPGYTVLVKYGRYADAVRLIRQG